MDAALKRLIRERAGNRCEYCRLLAEQSPLAPLQIEHILPRKHHGGDEADNLALACIDCNLHKGSNIAGIDPLSGEMTELFNPRVHRWEDHFALNGAYVAGITAIGRTTIYVLAMNSDEQVLLRSLNL